MGSEVRIEQILGGNDMGATDLVTVLRRKPFEPFRLFTNDGTVYEIRHPALVMVSLTGAVIGYPDPSRPGVMLHYDIVGLEHVVRLEELQRTAGKPTGNGSESS
jgi:hypothetical protein